MDSGNDDRIREQAYALWEKEGSPNGRETEFWERARLMVEAQGAGETTTPLQQRTEDEKKTDAAVEGTFPASDPPSFTAETGPRGVGDA